MAVNYYNPNGEQIAVVHFPGSGYVLGMQVVNDNIKRKIKVSDNLSIISIMNQQCYNTSPVAQQAEKNGFTLLNTALEENEWNNTLKISHILQNLEKVETDYALILDGRDTIITGNLNDAFIDRYKSFNAPIVFNATPFPHPRGIIEPLTELIRIKGKSKYLNAGVCIGEVSALKTLYEKAAEINSMEFNNIKNSEQLIIRKAKMKLPSLVKIDSESRIFRIVHQVDSVIKETDKGKVII